MRIETLNDRIANAKAKIEKKQNTIEKKTVQIDKKKAQIVKLGFAPDADRREIAKINNEVFWMMCDIDHLEEDIIRGGKEIEEIKESLKKYEAQLTGEIERESILLKDIPESMKRMQTELVEEWDRWDIRERDQIKADRYSMEYHDWCKKYRGKDTSIMYKTDEQIHNSNIQDAKMLILNLYYRVKAITGEVVDWAGIGTEVGTHGFTVLNGLVIGKEGRAYVESILAGGYNIQRLHVRVLVHER